ncbi:MAG: hypothetical protein WD059_03555 [Balneolaceae bacterium]
MSTSTKKTVWFGMKVTPEQKEKIKKLAQQKGVSQKEAVLELIESEVNEINIVAEPGSFLDEARDLIGIGAGPGDASTNPKYMKDFGK